MTGMLENASRLARDMRPCGVKVFHAPITFAPDGSDNPNKNLGILGGCDNERLFTRQGDSVKNFKPGNITKLKLNFYN